MIFLKKFGFKIKNYQGGTFYEKCTKRFKSGEFKIYFFEIRDCMVMVRDMDIDEYTAAAGLSWGLDLITARRVY